MNYIFDVDNTLFDAEHRLPLIKGPVKNWDVFFEAAKDDTPIFETINIARALAKAGPNVLIAVTGRPERIRNLTVEQFVKYRVPINVLQMRPDKDHRPDYVLKEEILDNIILPNYREVHGAFEDSPEVVAMYRRRGITVYDLGREA